MSEKGTVKTDLISAAVSGCLSVIMVLLMFSAVVLLLPRSELLQNYSAAAGKGALLIAAFIGGTVCRKTAKNQKLIYAELAGAILMIALLLIGAAAGVSVSGASVALDILLTAFGSFTSVLLPGKQKRGARKRGKYRS